LHGHSGVELTKPQLNEPTSKQTNGNCNARLSIFAFKERCGATEKPSPGYPGDGFFPPKSQSPAIELLRPMARRTPFLAV
jgi:hypothetical protein